MGVSGWELARAVSQEGQLGVVSGTGIGTLFSRRLQLGDPGGHTRRALAAFPDQLTANWALDQFFVEGGKHPDTSFKATALPQMHLPKSIGDLIVLGAFVEVWLAKEAHHGVVGINLLEKTQTQTLPALLGAMMAGVDYVLMGAGIPRQIPGVLDLLAEGKAAELRLDIENAGIEIYQARIDPSDYGASSMRRPTFFAIVASNTLAMTLARKSNGRVDGFVVEGPRAGGHNAPPRGDGALGQSGEPAYGSRDLVDLVKLKELGLPFYLAGGYGRPGKLHEALAAGANGIQVGTAFAFCKESSIVPELKAEVLRLGREGKLTVFTDPLASPTGFPFKVLQLDGTLWQRGDEGNRTRICDLGSLRKMRRDPDGNITYRCAAEPVDMYVAKGGDAADCAGRKCLCNSLYATIGLGQVRADGRRELPVVTAGDEAINVWKYLAPGKSEYTAAEVLRALLDTTGAAILSHESDETVACAAQLG